MSNENPFRVTPKAWSKFQEHYAWQLLQSPDYRLGQAFLNYFPDISTEIAQDGDHGTLFEMKLYYETDNERAKLLINQWVSGLTNKSN